MSMDEFVASLAAYQDGRHSREAWEILARLILHFDPRPFLEPFSQAVARSYFAHSDIYVRRPQSLSRGFQIDLYFFQFLPVLSFKLRHRLFLVVRLWVGVK